MSVCVCGQGEGQHKHDFSAALFQVITNKGQWGLWPLKPCCQRETPYQSLYSSEGFSSSKVTASKPSHGRWEGKLLVSRVMTLLYCIHHCGRLWFATCDINWLVAGHRECCPNMLEVFYRSRHWWSWEKSLYKRWDTRDKCSGRTLNQACVCHFLHLVDCWIFSFANSQNWSGGGQKLKIQRSNTTLSEVGNRNISFISHSS